MNQSYSQPPQVPPRIPPRVQPQPPPQNTPVQAYQTPNQYPQQYQTHNDQYYDQSQSFNHQGVPNNNQFQGLIQQMVNQHISQSLNNQMNQQSANFPQFNQSQSNQSNNNGLNMSGSVGNVPQPMNQRVLPQQPMGVGFGRGQGRGQGLGGRNMGLNQNFNNNGNNEQPNNQQPGWGQFIGQMINKNIQNTMKEVVQQPARFDVKLTVAQKQEFIDRGYIHLPDVVPKELINKALRAINRNLAQPPSQDKLPILRSITSCPDLVTSKVCMDLLNQSPALSYAEQLIGPTNRLMGCQIALRYPGDGCLKANMEKFGVMEKINQNNPLIGGVVHQLLGGDDEDSNYLIQPDWDKYWHIDGFPDAIKGLKTGQVVNFTCLLGILLSDAAEENFGNLTLYPGSHHILEQFFREKGGIIKFMEGTTFDGIQLVHKGVQPLMPAPVQLKAKAGDIVIAHYQLAHSIAPNISPNIRYVIYYRLHSHRHILEQPKPECLTNIWLDFEGITDLTKNRAYWVPN